MRRDCRPALRTTAFAVLAAAFTSGPLLAGLASGGFIRGDANQSEDLDLSDAVYIFGYLFEGDKFPRCLDALDANDDGELDISDGIDILGFLFLGAPPLPPPFPNCGVDGDDRDPLTCDAFPACGGPALTYFLVGLRGRPDIDQYQFIVAASEPGLLAASREQLALPEGERNVHVSGKLDFGNGGFNAPWTWQILPDQWGLAEFSIELCDGLPEHVENDRDYWVNTVGTFCPWSSYLKEEIGSSPP